MICIVSDHHPQLTFLMVQPTSWQPIITILETIEGTWPLQWWCHHIVIFLIHNNWWQGKQCIDLFACGMYKIRMCYVQA